MKLTISLLLVFSMLAVTMVGGANSSAKSRGNNSPAGKPLANYQNPDANRDATVFSNHYRHKLPRNAVPGSTAERKAAWDRLTPEQRQALAEKIRPHLERARAIAARMEPAGEPDELTPSSLVDGKGKRQLQTLRRAKQGDPLRSVFISGNRQETPRTAPGHEPKRTPAASGQRHHARAATTAASGAALTSVIDQFLKNSFPTPRPAPGNPAADNSVAGNTNSESLAKRTPAASAQPPSSPPMTGDDDADGLTDTFETSLADTFTPYYHISTDEPNHFARFGDYVPETVTQTVSPYAPISHYRVTPLGFSANHTLAYLRIDYMTLWDEDGGFDIDWFCELNINTSTGYLSGDIVYIIDQIVLLLAPHNLDNERSATLVAAPVADPNNPTYSTNVADYSAYAYFLSAHFGTLGDQSVILYPGTPIPATGPSHIELVTTRSKHATYTFDPNDTSYPNGLPLVPWVVIFASYAAIDALLFFGIICFPEWLAITYALDVSFFSCLVEHFGDSGGRYADPRLNVGEVGQPFSGFHFIQGGELYTQLTTAIPW